MNALFNVVITFSPFVKLDALKERARPPDNVVSFIRLRRRPWALPVDECVTCASTLYELRLDASADSATSG